MLRELYSILDTRFYLLIIILILLLSGCGGDDQRIYGAGATFPYPVYDRWGEKYNELTGTELIYDAVGSSKGVQSIKDGVVDFGASDAPLQLQELEQEGLIQFPMVIGGVVPVINLPGVGANQLQLTGEVLALIYLGEITQWNDPAIITVNEGLQLPEKEITVVHRSEGSGTSWIFTNYLSQVSSQWQDQIGIGKSVIWPVGVGGEGNGGVAALVGRIEGAIGYVEYSYSVSNDMTSIKMENKNGQVVKPAIYTFQAAAANAEWAAAPGFYMLLTNQPGPESWPIAGASFILIHKTQDDLQKAKAMLNYFSWCYHNGDDIASELHYIPMPSNVIELVEQLWRQTVRTTSQATVWE